MNNEPLLILPEPEVLTINDARFRRRKYWPIWAKCLEVPGRKVIIKMVTPTDASFRTIRKALWKIKDEDRLNGHNWRLICERVGDKMHFHVIPADITMRI